MYIPILVTGIVRQNSLESFNEKVKVMLNLDSVAFVVELRNGPECGGAEIHMNNGDIIYTAQNYNFLKTNIKDSMITSESLWENLRDSAAFNQIMHKFINDIGIEISNAFYETIQYLQKYGFIRN